MVVERHHWAQMAEGSLAGDKWEAHSRWRNVYAKTQLWKFIMCQVKKMGAKNLHSVKLTCKDKGYRQTIVNT